MCLGPVRYLRKSLQQRQVSDGGIKVEILANWSQIISNNHILYDPGEYTCFSCKDDWKTLPILVIIVMRFMRLYLHFLIPVLYMYF